jgi:exodeoxyribonuclease VII large subunit
VDRAVRFSESTPLDLLIVGRGGGSAEDLAAFNDERLARAIDACPIPVVSAVGHEIDFSIADFVADRRAATPTAAAELAVPDRADVCAALATRVNRMGMRLESLHRHLVRQAQAALKSYVARAPQRALERLEQRLDQQFALMPRSIARVFLDRRSALVHLEDVLRLSDPRLPLQRGYSLTFVEGSTRPLRDAAEVSTGQSVTTRLAKGRLSSRVEEVMPE